ncbi:MAG: type 2 isopentenyl-diphosphate Delta-isomerase [Anaerolineaceae bacterium]
MKKVSQIKTRKADHLKINLQQDVQSSITTGLERIGLVHQALPEMALDKVDTSLSLFGRKLSAPIIISSMTGGTPAAGRLNFILAETAQTCQVAMGLGSFRAALDHPEVTATYQVRRVAPDILLFANLGAVQLNYGYTSEHCLRAVNECNADALILHLNPLQEALQPEGETDFSGLLKKIEDVCRILSVPVVIKEVGWGISAAVARQLVNAGVTAIDVAGAGGTSWSQVEMHRWEDIHLANIVSVFRGWGIPTAQSIWMVKQQIPRLTILASGGLRDGIDIAKCIALGATAGGIAGPFLKAATQSLDKAIQAVDEVKQQLKIAMFAAGARNLKALSKVKTIEVIPVRENNG